MAGMPRAHMDHAARVAEQIGRILQGHKIRGEQRLDRLRGGMFAVCWTAQSGDVFLELSISHDGEDGSADYLAVLLRIDHPDDPERTLQQFKLLLVLHTSTWHSSTAGQLGFALDAQPNLTETVAMEAVDRLARWFSDPHRQTPLLPEGAQ